MWVGGWDEVNVFEGARISGRWKTVVATKYDWGFAYLTSGSNEDFCIEKSSGNGRSAAFAVLRGVAIALRSPAKPYHGLSKKFWYGRAFIVSGISRHSRICWNEWFASGCAFKNESWTVIFKEEKTFGAWTSPGPRKPRQSSSWTEKSEKYSKTVGKYAA